MSLDNVQLWFAKDKEGEIVTINEVDKEDKEKYYCPLCNSEVIPRQGEINSWCFAHIDKSKCSSESMYHFWVKNKLLQKGDTFKIQTDIEKEYICEDILVEETYKIDDKEYRPDLTVKTTEGDIIYFEMNYTNEKKLEDYLDTWIGLGNTAVEVDVKTLINSESGKLPIFKAKYYNGKCFNVKKGEDKIYHDTIGKHKEDLIRNNEYDKKKKDIEKLDWFWKDVQRYKMNEVDIEHVSELIQNIESQDRYLVIDILKKISCNDIIKDFVEYRKRKLCEGISKTVESIEDKKIIPYIKCKFKTPHFLYDRIYGVYDFDGIYYKNEKLHFDFPDVSRNKILKEIISIENEINKEKNFNKEIELFVLKYTDLKQNISIQGNKIKLIKFYRDRDFEFIVDNRELSYETQVHYKVYFKKSIERQETVHFCKYDYKKSFDYICNKIKNIINKMEKSIMINPKTNADKKILEDDNLILDSLSDIISNDNKKVKNYIIGYDSNNGYIKYVYFKDYKDKNFLICNKDNLNESEIYEFVKDKYKIINIKDINRYSDFTLYESKLTYKIKKRISLKYKHDDYLQLEKIYLSFNKKDKNYVYLSRYDFVEAKRLLREINENIKSFIKNKTNECEILDSDYLYSKEINNKIRQVLYPIICANKRNYKTLKIKLNIHFTKDVYGRLQPWVIKDFIEELNKIFEYNIEIENVI